MRERTVPPTVVVLCAAPTASAREVLAGIEEEGVPHSVHTVDGDGQDAVTLAHRAARLSPLDVGVGVDEHGRVCVHHTKLPAASPVELSTRAPGEARRLGHNAARVVVGIPLKPPPDPRTSVHNTGPYNTKGE